MKASFRAVRSALGGGEVKSCAMASETGAGRGSLRVSTGFKC